MNPSLPDVLGSKQSLPTKYVGVDGCPAGWFAIWCIVHPEGQPSEDESIGYAIFNDISDLMSVMNDARRILIDIPIGLKVDAPRQLEARLRKLLGPKRSSVFPVPVRSAVYAANYEEACQLNVKGVGKKLSKQSWNICGKIRQVDQYLIEQDSARQILLESHPELAFQRLSGKALAHGKKTRAGIDERLEILGYYSTGFSDLFSQILVATKRASLARDDILDAMALLLSAINCEQLPFEAEQGFDAIPIRMSTFNHKN